MATDAAAHRLRRPAAPEPAAHPPVHVVDRSGRTTRASEPSEEFSYV